MKLKNIRDLVLVLNADINFRPSRVSRNEGRQSVRNLRLSNHNRRVPTQYRRTKRETLLGQSPFKFKKLNEQECEK